MPYNPYPPYSNPGYSPNGFGYNPNPYNQPQAQPQPQQPQMNAYAFVNGVEGAKSFQLSPNQAVLLMDSDRPILYKKVTNAMGQASIQYFEIKEIDEAKARGGSAVPASEYVRVEDFNKLVERVNSLLPKKEE